jgi:opacity protein-like surface antigen
MVYSVSVTRAALRAACGVAVALVVLVVLAPVVPTTLSGGSLVASRLAAQALNYPAMQVPSVSNRDFTGALVGSQGTMLLFQWREEASSQMHFGLDAGLYDSNRRNSSMSLFVAGSLGKDLARASREQPLDLLLTAGAGVSIGNNRNGVRLPFGVSMGHTFELDQGMAITPFVHPRVSVDLCSSCSPRGRSQTDVSLNFDLGASFDVSRKLAVRVAALFSGADQFGGGDAISVGLTWTPDGLKR